MVTPMERFARWYTLERGMKCKTCDARLQTRGDRFCSTGCALEHVVAEAI